MSPVGDEFAGSHAGQDGETANSPPAISVQTSSQNTQQHLGDIANAKTRSSIPQNSSTTGLRELTRSSVDPGVPDGYNDLTRSPVVPAERTGLYRIRQQPMRQPPSPNLQPSSPKLLSPISSRKPSMNAFAGGPISPGIPPSEDLSRFPTESLHSFSFAHQSSDTLENRNAVIKRSVDFLTNKLQWAATTPRIASAQARLAGDEEVLSMIELLQKANVTGAQPISTADTGAGPLTGPAHHTSEDIFASSWGQKSESPTAMEKSTSPTFATSGIDSTDGMAESTSSSSLSTVIEGETSDKMLARIPTSGIEDMPTAPQRTPLKRTYTDTAGYSLHNRLTEAMARPYREDKSSRPIVPQIPPRSNTNVTDRAPHGHNRNAPNQAIFTTENTSPWTITAANDLACLVFGVTRAEVRKLGIMEVIREDRRKWLEEKLRNPESGTAPNKYKQPPPPAGKIGLSNGLASMRNGVTAKLLSKPPARQTAQSRRSKTVDGTRTPPKENLPKDPHHSKSKSRGVLLCGDVVPIRKMNGSNGSASLWVKEKGNNLIWVLEEIAEDVAIITVDEIGLVLRGSGDIEAIFGLDRVRNGMDVQRLIPAWPKIQGTSTGAVDYEALARLRRFTARTSNSISIPVTIDQMPEESVFRVSSFPHIAGIIVVNPATMRVSSSNSVFAAALFGHSNPDGLAVAELIPSFDKILRVMTDEDKIALVDGIVIPEHSFRRARALLALREGSADAAAIFLRPSGVPAKHRDGAEIMIDVQMRVVKSDRDPIYNETVIEEDQPSSSSEVVYALWITYSRQLHAVNHGVGPVTSLISRPSTPPHQPAPGPSVDSPAPSPMPITENALASPLDEELEKKRSSSSIEMTASPDGEPFEHPSPDLIAANVKIIQKKKISDFNILEEMGQGAYGQVKLARYKKSGATKMCIKYVTKRRILVDTWHRDRRLGTVPLEIHVLDYLRRDGLQHPNIVEMADFFEDDVNYYIEMIPHGLPGMDLFDYIELRVTMEESECRKIFRQVAEALRHLHIEAKVVHRDIKDENVILDGEGRVKLVDFGSAAYIKNGPFDVFVGTIDYAAPEVLRGSPYRGKEQDVWALGILLYTIVYKENPFYSIDEIMDHDLRVPYVLSEDCIDLIRKMLDRDVERRIGIQAVMAHPWVTYVDEEDENAEKLELPVRKGLGIEA